MELTVRLEDSADIPFLKKMLSQIKGIKSIEVSEEEEVYSWNETENSETFAKVMEQSDQEYKKGDYRELNDDLLDTMVAVK